MTILDTFYILFESKTENLDKGLGEAEKKSEGLIDKLKKIDPLASKSGENLFKLVKQGAGLLGVGVGLGALVAGVKSTAAAYDELGKLAARFRSTADAVDEFRDAAGLLGIDEEKSVAALTGLDTAIQDTYLGLGRAKAVFEELGIKVTDANGKIKPTTEVMGELAAKFKGMERGTQIRVMERLGLDPALLKLFNADLAALQQRMAAVDEASGFNLEEAVKRSKEYTKASKDMALEVNVLRMFLGKLLENFRVATLPYFTEAMTKASKYVRAFTDFLMSHRRAVEGVFIGIGAAIMYFLVPAAIKGAAATLVMLAPFLLIGAAVAAVGAAFVLLYDDIMSFIDGNDSLIGQVLQKYPAIGAAVKAVGAAFSEAWDLIKGLGEFLISVWNNPAQAFADFVSVLKLGMSEAGDFVMGIWDAIVEKVMGVINAVKDGVSKVASFLGFGGASDAVAAGQQQIGAAASSPMASQTSSSISNSRMSSKSTSVQIGKVEVQTQATDAAGISKAIGGTMTAQMRQTVSNFDDGVVA